jgi:YHYH protein/Fibronectin type III domain
MIDCRAVLLMGLAAGLTACGGGSSGTPTPTPTPTPNTVPGAPTALVATAGNGSISLAFTAPASNGGTAITGYTGSCTAAGAAVTATAVASPVAISGLTNGSSYSCTVTASNAVGSSAASAAVTATPAASAGTVTTAGVLCPLSYSAFNSSSKVNATSQSSWTCSGSLRQLTSNGIPDHPVTDGNFATPISTQSVSTSMRLQPTNTGSQTSGAGNVGYVVNGVKLDPGTAGTCAATATGTGPGQGCVQIAGNDPWRIEALGGAFTFGTDSSNAHVQPTGDYHYHGMPEGYITRLNKGQALTLVAWAKDGFPIYARYGYTNPNDATSAIKVLRGSFQKKAAPDAGRPANTTIFPMGTFTQDYEYVAGSGDLDECNGRFGVTPEFPNGIYHYYITDTYPFIQRCVKGPL